VCLSQCVFLSGSYQYNIFNEFEKELDRLALNLGGCSLSDPNAKDERTDNEKIIESLIGKATVTYYAGEYHKSIHLLENVTAIVSDIYEAWHNKGVVLGNLNRQKEAIEAFNHAIKSKPDVHETWYQKGIALCKLNRHEEAIGALDQAIGIKPDDYKAWYNIGASLDSLGRQKEAIKAYNKSTKIKLRDNTENSSD